MRVWTDFLPSSNIAGHHHVTVEPQEQVFGLTSKIIRFADVPHFDTYHFIM
jgi:hypothetical protein